MTSLIRGPLLSYDIKAQFVKLLSWTLPYHDSESTSVFTSLFNLLQLIERFNQKNLDALSWPSRQFKVESAPASDQP